MTYPLHGNHPQNLLVANQFNPDSFQIVQQVYYSLDQLRVIFKHLDVINSIGSNIYRIKDIEPYLRDIHYIGSELNKLINLEHNIPFLMDIAPRVEQFVGMLHDVISRTNYIDEKFNNVLGLMESNTKQLEDLYCQYEQGLQCLIEQYKEELCDTHSRNMQEAQALHKEIVDIHTSIKSAMPMVQEARKNQESTVAVLEHLKASDLVNLAQFTGSEEDYQKAFKQIKLSEKYGNDETINRHRLEYKLPDNNLFDVLNANRERLTKEKE